MRKGVVLDKTDQGELNRHLEDIYRAMGIGIIATVCMDCGVVQGFKDGEGCYGISHGFCRECKGRAIGGKLRIG